MSRNNGLFLALASTLLLAGCADYLNRYDSVTLAAGDAPKHNIMLQTVDPFNPASANTTITSDGVRAAAVIKKYQTPGQGSQPAQNVTVNVGAPN